MCMMLSQCIGCEIFCLRRAVQIAQLMVPCDAQLIVLVEHVAPDLDERVFAQIAQVMVPCDAQLSVVLVEHVAPALDERVFAQIAQVVVPFDTPHAVLSKKPNSCPTLEGQVHLSGDIEYVRALGKTFEAGGQPVKNREMRSLAQRGNQANFFYRMPGVQRSPIAYNLQHLREYNSCRIWASQSRRPTYVADVEGRARVEGVAVSIHESYMDAHGSKVAEDAVFKSPCVVIIFDEAP